MSSLVDNSAPVSSASRIAGNVAPVSSIRVHPLASSGSGTNDDTPAAVGEPGPHPLARSLAAEIAARPSGSRILLLGIGNGRSIPVLLEAGARIDAFEEDAARARGASRRFANEARLRVTQTRYADPARNTAVFAAALSTHALLHGTRASIAAALAAVRESLAPGAPFFVTLGSKQDARFGHGRCIAPDTFAPEDGDEAGVAHTYFDEDGARELFHGFSLTDVRETNAARIVGRWAHRERETGGIVHWWVRAQRGQ